MTQRLGGRRGRTPTLLGRALPALPSVCTLLSGCGPSIAQSEGDTAVALAELDVSPAVLSFGTVVVGDTATETLSVANFGDASARVDLEIQATLATAWSLAEGQVDVDPGEHANVDVTIAPTGWGDHSGVVLLTSGDWTAQVSLSVSVADD